MSGYLIPVALSSEIDDNGFEHIHAATIRPAARTILPLTVTGNISDDTVGNAISGSYMGHGGIPPYRFSVLSGALPSGLTLLEDGTYSGTYTTASLYSWTIKIVDSANNSDTLVDTVTINV